MIGVDYDLFWTLNPKSLSAFRKAFKLKRDYDDIQQWSLGNYIRMAVASVLSNKAKYPNKPVGYTRQSEGTMETIKERFLMQAKRFKPKTQKGEK